MCVVRTSVSVHAGLSQHAHGAVQGLHLKRVGSVGGQRVDGAHDGVLAEAAEDGRIERVARRRRESV